MKVIIAGSRSICKISTNQWDYLKLVDIIDQAITESGFEITAVISGGANGPDKAGELWAESNDIPVILMKPNWSLGRGAGMIRNSDMVKNGDALIAIHDGVSRGTQDTINKMRKKGCPTLVKVIKNEDE